MVEGLQQKLKLLQDAKEHDDGALGEIEKLYLEKAELLSNASEDATNTERRIREAVATCTAALEAEVVTEKVGSFTTYDLFISFLILVV
jgi:hypothetical protein